MDVQHEEFERWMNLLRQDIQTIHVRLDAVTELTHENKTDIAVLRDREGREAQKGGMLAGGVVTAIAAAIEIARHWFSK